MRAVILAGIAPLFILAATFQGPTDEPAAVLVKADGEVEIHLDGNDPRPARVGDKLAAGDQVVPGAGSRAVIVHRTGASQEVTSAFTVQAQGGSDDDGDMFSRTVGVLSRAADSDARAQPNRQGMIRPLPGQAVPVAPRNDLAVAEVRPTLTWFSVSDSPGYRIHLWEADGSMRTFETGLDTVWTLPEEEGGLTPGAAYEWTAAPLESGRLAERHAFRVLDEEGTGALEGELERLVSSGLDPEGDGLFLAAVLYRDYGLFYDALAALEELEATGSEMSRDALLLKGEVLDALGRLDEAEHAFDRADGLVS